MDGSIYSDQVEEFFKSSDKAAVTDNATTGIGLAAFGIYQEDSVDISTLLETYNDTGPACQQPASSPLRVTSYNDDSTFQFCGRLMNGHDPLLDNIYGSGASLTVTGESVISVDDPNTSPGRTPRGSKKRSVNKRSDEYQVKRERNNIAVRKSRNKTKMRVQETEQRVKELEEENTQLLNKIAMLNKELNVLKNLFTSAGVAQPARGPVVKEEFAAEQ